MEEGFTAGGIIIGYRFFRLEVDRAIIGGKGGGGGEGVGLHVGELISGRLRYQWDLRGERPQSLSNDDDDSTGNITKNEFASFQTSSRLRGPDEFVKCRQFLLELDSKGFFSGSA